MSRAPSLLLRRAVVPAVLALATVLSPAAAEATTSRLLSQEDLARQADRIVVGRVVERRSEWAGTRIVTRQRIAIEETWAGEPSSELTVSTLGGVVDGIGQNVAGAGHLKVGDRAVLFVHTRADGSTWAVGMWQGVFRIDPDATPTAPTLRRDGDGVRVVGEPTPMPSTLPALRDAVRELRRAP